MIFYREAGVNQFFFFKPFARLLFSCNRVPKNYTDSADGFYRRLCIIRCDNVISADKKDVFLKEKLAAEIDGILAWAMVGLKRLMERDFVFPETERTRAELNHYKTDNSSTLAFVEECCKMASGLTILRTELYEAYEEFCSQNGQKPSSQTRFNSELENLKGVERANDVKTRRSLWNGIALS